MARFFIQDIKEPDFEPSHISIPMTEDHFTIGDDALLRAINKIIYIPRLDYKIIHCFHLYSF